jgi:CRISPR-associated endonuclease Csy4
MDHFVDIQLLPDPELSCPVLMSALYAKLHRALVLAAGEGGDIAVSFPGYNMQPGRATLGTNLRLVASQPALRLLVTAPWMGGLGDHVTVSPLTPVPHGAKHRSLRRAQAKSNPERLRRRLIKRHGIDEAQARERIPDSAAETLDLPYLQIRSSSTGQGFRLFLQLGPEQETAAPGSFNAYGLSTTATVPWF